MKKQEENIQARMDELESRLAFQDDLIESLNEVVARQDSELARITNQLKALAAKINDYSESASERSAPSGHEIPPHY